MSHQTKPKSAAAKPAAFNNKGFHRREGSFKKNSDGLPILAISNGAGYNEWVDAVSIELKAKFGSVANVLATRIKVLPEAIRTIGIGSFNEEDARALGISFDAAFMYDKWRRNKQCFTNVSAENRALFILRNAVATDNEEAATRRAADSAARYDHIASELSMISDITDLIKSFNSRVCDKRLRETTALRSNEMLCFANVIKCLSPESVQAVRNSFPAGGDIDANNSYEKMCLEDNLTMLSVLLHKTHLKSCIGIEACDNLNIDLTYRNIRQMDGELVSNYYMRSIRALKAMGDAGLQLPSAEMQAAQFIMGLDYRHKSFQNDLKNWTCAGVATYPVNLNDAYEITRNQQIDRLVTPGRTADVAFTSSTGDDEFKLKSPKKFNKAKNNRAKEKSDIPASSATTTVKCLFCDKTNHVTDRCFKLKAFKKEQLQQSSTNTAMVATTTTNKKKKSNNNLAGVHFNDEVLSEDEDEDLYDDVGAATILVDDDDDVNNEVDHTIELVMLASKKGLLNPGDQVLDNGATVSIFKDESLLTQLEERGRPVRIHGLNGTVKTSMTGFSEKFGRVYFSPEALINLLSFSELEAKGFHIEYVPKGSFFVTTADGEICEFKRTPVGRNYKGGCLFIYNSNRQTTVTNAIAAVTTVSENESRFTKIEVAKAKAARDLIKKLGYIAPADLIYQINHGSMLNCPVTARDVIRSQIIYGKSLGALKGKTVDNKIKDIVPSNVQKLMQTDLDLYIDVMFVSKQPFLISTSAPLGLVTTIDLNKKRDANSIWTAVQSTFRSYEAQGFRIKFVHTDGEGGVFKNRDKIEAMGAIMNPKGPGKHVAQIERKIRQIKERIRGIWTTLPYDLPATLVPWLVKFVTHAINCCKSTTRIDPSSARELFTGIKVDLSRDFKIAFGQYVQVQVPNLVKNSMKERTAGAIALSPKGNNSGSVYFYLLGTGKIVLRDQYYEMPMTQDIVTHLNNLSKGSLDDLPETFDQPNDEVTAEAEPSHIVPTQIEKEADLPIIIDSTANIQPVDNATTVSESDDLDQTRSKLFGRSSVVTDNEMEMIMTVLTREEFAHRAPDKDINRFSYKFGVKIFGELATEAVTKEFMQMLNMGVFQPVHRKDIPNDADVIRTLMFLKAKYGPDGSFEKLKARLVALGNQQSVSDDETSSPTLDMTAFGILLARAASKCKVVSTADIPCAYLKAKRPVAAGKRRVCVRLDRHDSAIIVALRPEWAMYLDEFGCLTLLVLQALYGLTDSGLLWYLTMSEFLMSIGFRIHPMDKCVFVHSEKEIEICLYVDDLLIFTETQIEMEWLSNHLTTKFGEISQHTGDRVNYLGIALEFDKQNGSVSMSMPKHIKDILLATKTNRTSTVPYGADLFKEDADSPSLELQEKDGFRSVIASLLYIAKRVRPDILLPVQYLSTKVGSPTHQHKLKLQKVLQYLAGTLEFKIRIEADEGLPVLAHVDASYGCYADGKGQTGVYVSLGKGPIFVKSTKQKLTGKSSTEAELIGVSDALSQVLWIRDFIKHLNGNKEPATLFQDNTSTIRILERGIADGPTTKHINIRYHFVKERIDLNEVKVVHMNTKKMIADIFTKPLPVSAFVILRDLLLNYKK